MRNPIVECIANYSEARHSEVVEAIMTAVTSVPGIHILDRHSDLDHNRTVLTFIGGPEAVEEAAYRSIACAAQRINLDEHTGEHPRIGATDVVPFVPIANISMQDCVQMAHRLGARVGAELEIPVYLYEEAATRPERQNLESIRRGQYEALKDEIASNPERTPDFGPHRVGPAGATVIGARHALIAFNVYLNTPDTTVAQKVARAVRHSSGGLRYIKALGLQVEGLAQVSMNLINYHGTPLARVVETIRREAARYGVAIHHSELVGLIPQQALVDAAVWYLQLDQFEEDQILETRIYAAPNEETPESGDIASQAGALETPASSFLDALASGTATPGGGSASAFSGAAAAALVAMVARLTIGKKKYAGVESLMRSLLDQAEELRSRLLALVAEDSAAFEKVMAAVKLPKETPEQAQERVIAIETATMGAILVPQEVARHAVKALELAAEVVTHGNLNAISDGGTAAGLARAAIFGAGLNVRINAAALSDPSAAHEALDELRDLENRAAKLEGEVQSIFVKRGGLSSE